MCEYIYIYIYLTDEQLNGNKLKQWLQAELQKAANQFLPKDSGGLVSSLHGT